MTFPRINPAFRTTLLFIIFFELLSFFVHWIKIAVAIENIILVVAVLAIFIISLIKIEYGIYAAIAELLIGSKGHLLALSISPVPISLRIGIFIAVMLAWIIYIIRKKQFSSVKTIILQNKLLLLLAIIYAWGLLFAFVRHNSLQNILLDFNAWIFFLYIFPFLTVLNSNKQLLTIIEIAKASLLAVSLKTMLFLYVFSHYLPVMKDFYKWGRDTLWGEFTLLDGNFYRIFSQSQIFALIGFFVIFLLVVNKTKEWKWLYSLAILLMATLIISLSRSFWLAGIVTMLAGAIFIIINSKTRLKITLRIAIMSFFAIVLPLLIIFITVKIPLPKTSIEFSADTLKERLKLSESAISSRWSQLPELTHALIKHPLIGSGWGTAITYKSFDPRIMTIKNPNGLYTTYAFEWGYLDIILKIGLIGLAVYLLLIGDIIRKLWFIYQKEKEQHDSVLFMGLILGLTALLITHGFSPYLNHPLGIGYLLLLLTIIHFKTAPTKSL